MISQILTKLKANKILLLGFGREGKSTYQFIRKHLPELEIGIYDKNQINEKLENVVLHNGNSYEEILSDYDIIIKSPGIVFHSKNNKALKKLTSQTELFLEFYRDQTIGITGTKGKSTTTSLLYHVLKEVKRPVVLAGNIGIPVFNVLEEIMPDTLVVYEMSSHQLEYVTHSPHIGLHLNIYQEHLDHYGTFEKYAVAKENIYKFQQKGDLLLYNKEFLDVGKHPKQETITISNTQSDADVVVKENQISYKDTVLDLNEDEMLLIGQHNIYNIGAAYAIVKYLGISEVDFEVAVKTFQPLPHRLEYVAEVQGVKFYNDSISTICETTIQAVKSIKNIDTVILGGMDRGIEYQPLVDYLMETNIRNFILMPDTGLRIQKLMQDMEKVKDHTIYLAANVQEAVEVARKVTASGKTCLFSPAAASYGFFKNFEERGDIFKKFVLGIS